MKSDDLKAQLDDLDVQIANHKLGNCEKTQLKRANLKAAYDAALAEEGPKEEAPKEDAVAAKVKKLAKKDE